MGTTTLRRFLCSTVVVIPGPHCHFIELSRQTANLFDGNRESLARPGICRDQIETGVMGRYIDAAYTHSVNSLPTEARSLRSSAASTSPQLWSSASDLTAGEGFRQSRVYGVSNSFKTFEVTAVEGSTIQHSTCVGNRPHNVTPSYEYGSSQAEAPIYYGQMLSWSASKESVEDAELDREPEANDSPILGNQFEPGFWARQDIDA